jgi:hypothetical protein
MPLFNSRELFQIGSQVSEITSRSADTLLKSYKSLLVYDIFLSHSYRDATIILGLRAFIEHLGFSVYVDWLVDEKLDRTKVTKDTARLLKTRMANCNSLLFAISVNSPNSVWMPWELGYFDGLKPGMVAILPITSSSENINTFKGQEYLGLYPYISKVNDKAGKMKLWVEETPEKYIIFDKWLSGSQPILHSAGS